MSHIEVKKAESFTELLGAQNSIKEVAGNVKAGGMLRIVMDVHAGVSEFFKIYNRVAQEQICQNKVVPVDIFHDYEFEEYKYPWPFSNRYSGYLVMRRLMRNGSLVICRLSISESAWKESCPANFRIASTFLVLCCSLIV